MTRSRWSAASLACTAPIDTSEETLDNSLVIFEPGQNIVGKRRGGRSPPTTGVGLRARNGSLASFFVTAEARPIFPLQEVANPFAAPGILLPQRELVGLGR